MSQTTVILLPQELSIMNIEDSREGIFHQFTQADSMITLDGSQISRVDTAGVQFLCLLFIQAAQEDKSISWQAPSETLIQTVKLLGLDKNLLM